MSTTDHIRAFNRFYTNRIGLLGRSVTGELSLTEARILYEIGANRDTTARRLTRLLGFDEGYLSRVIKRLKTRALIEKSPSRKDARVNTLGLTRHGKAALAKLVQLAQAAIEDMVADVPQVSQTQLVTAMATIEGILSWPDVAAPELRPFRTGDLGWVVQRHGELYAAREGYDLRFEGLVARILGDFVTRDDRPRETGWILHAGGLRLGCVFVIADDATTARLRLLLLEPFARGRGLGEKLLSTAIDHARAQGYTRLVLWTHQGLREACGLYEKAGFRLTESTPSEAFGQSVIDQRWELPLRPV